ncbi:MULTISPECIES: hypothetical protein [Vibrio harveyi group]|uniref:hypothetical protein n=1 Tax=Vibrio harveyi group TaxID=717610 RepID=UPI000A2FF217|nr:MULTISPECIES: hypothetical protein [Vibrio harveyi group]ARR10529.1 unknow [Vibrio campbellii]WHP52970.1 hypothetical protein QMY43_24940 [Vibrio parahaemolyticus]
MFNPEKFLDHVVLSLRNLGVDLTPVAAPKNSIERTNNPNKESYKITIWGHTPNYEGEQPAYKTTMFYYPEDKKMFVNADWNGDWNHVLFPNCDGLNKVEYTLKSHGLVNLDMTEITVIIE